MSNNIKSTQNAGNTSLAGKYIVVILLSIISFFINTCGNSSGKNESSGRITITGAFALYPLTVKWANEFNKLHPEIRFDISAGGAGKGITDVLSDIVDIGLVSREINSEETKRGAVNFAVAKDAVVPTISNSNPYLNILLDRGLKINDFKDIWITGRQKEWSNIGFINSSTKIHVYTRSDACGAAETWAKYLGKKQEDLSGVGVFGDPGLATAVKNDPYGIGYNNIVYVFDSKTKKQTNGLRIVPIDLNGNGKIDKEEDFYSDVNLLVNAITYGKYPSPPARELYFVTHAKHQNRLVTKFIEWVLTDGQKFINEEGYIKLPDWKIQSEFQQLGNYVSK